MHRPIRWTVGLGCFAGLAVVGVSLVGMISCGTAPTPFLVQGPNSYGNEPPTLTITNPTANFTRGKGDSFIIQWTDSDRDSNASISFSLLNTATNSQIVLAAGLDEDDSTGPSSLLVGTTLIPIGTYNIKGTIADEDSSVDSYALVTGSASTRVVVTIVEEGSGPQTVPPTLTVTAPTFSLSVTQDDQVVVTVQPVLVQPAPPLPPIPFDPDSGVALYLIFDLDNNPNNDDPLNPDPSKIIVLETRLLAVEVSDVQTFTETIDLATVPARPSGDPYFIRISAFDGTNPRVDRYAEGTINVVQLAAGVVDLAAMGRTLSGAKLRGFNPGANLGSSVSRLGDFDADGVDDFVVVAQFGNPQNVGPVGEAYLLYGQDGLRFGGNISVNSIADTISGVVFQAPPVRTDFAFDPFPQTDGITDVSVLPDLSGDGRPEIIFGLPHVHGAFDGTDYDPADTDLTDVDPLGCYPDLLVNNLTNAAPGRDVGFYAGGMAVMVNSQNRDNEGFINVNRLESTAIDLELSGQPGVIPPRLFLDSEGFDRAGNIFARADNASTPDEDLGNDPPEGLRIAGARFIAGGFEYVRFLGAPRQGKFGQNVGSLGDLNSDGLDEIILSAPRNERYLADLRTDTPSGFFNPMLESTLFTGSIVVLPGTNYNQEVWRDIDDETGTCINPFLDHHNHATGNCDPPAPRHYDIPVDSFEIYAEDIDDMLGGGRSAGDFNQDGLGDILCGAPLNDRRASALDTGATYIIYGRTVFGQVLLSLADNPPLRPPMLRIRGVSPDDEIGWKQTSGLDINGDRVDDVFISSPKTDYGDVVRLTCTGIFNRVSPGVPNDLREVTFNNCLQSTGSDVFSDDPCKVYDYDNDEDIDEADRCIFCCQSPECEPDSSCVLGQNPGNCCQHLVDNGFVGIVFGDQRINGDRDITQLATPDLPGVIFYGGRTGDRAGIDISSAGDFDHDGFGDILISAPGEVRCDDGDVNLARCESRLLQRVGVTYLVFGGTHLANKTFNLSDPQQGVGSESLRGIVFLSPYEKGRPNEAAPSTVGFIGDINSDGFGDILIGNPKADSFDLNFPQLPGEPGSDPATGRLSNTGDAYIIYGNNFGSNRGSP